MTVTRRRRWLLGSGDGGRGVGDDCVVCVQCVFKVNNASKACWDSQLVTQQLGGHCEIKKERMKSYVDRVRELGNQFSQMAVEQIARMENQRANFLAKIGSSLIDCRQWKITVLGVGKGEQVLAISDNPKKEGNRNKRGRKRSWRGERDSTTWLMEHYTEKHSCQ